MILHTLREIADHMRVSRSQILKWRNAADDPAMAFPLVPRFDGHGSRMAYYTDTELIKAWMQRRADACKLLSRTMQPRLWKGHNSPQSAARAPRLHEAQPKRQRALNRKPGPSKHVSEVVDNPISELSPFDTISQVSDK